MKATFLFGLCAALAAAVGCSSSPSHVAYVALPFDNAVGAYRISDDSGSFTKVPATPFASGTSPAVVAVHPSNKLLYTANQSENTISLFTIDASTGALTEVTPRTPTGVTPSSMALDSSGGFLFVANRSSNTISAFSVDSGSGALTAVSGSPFTTPPSPTAMLLTPSGKFLYVADANLAIVSAYSVASGVLSPVAGSPFAVGNGPAAMIVDSGEKFLYVANSFDNTVSGFAIASTGALSLIAGTPIATGTGPCALAFDSTEAFLYAANFTSTNISGFAVDSTSGKLTVIDKSPFTGPANPTFMVLAPSGKYFLIGSQSAKTISEYTIDASDPPTGALTSSKSVTLDAAPVSLGLAK